MQGENSPITGNYPTFFQFTQTATGDKIVAYGQKPFFFDAFFKKFAFLNNNLPGSLADNTRKNPVQVWESTEA